jgi:protein SCO1/2
MWRIERNEYRRRHVRFVARHHVTDARWHFLTGDAPTFESLARSSYFVRLDRDTTYGVSSIAHTESVLLVDSRGRLRGVYAGSLPLEIDRLRDDIKLLLREGNSG